MKVSPRRAPVEKLTQKIKAFFSFSRLKETVKTPIREIRETTATEEKIYRFKSIVLIIMAYFFVL